MTTYGDPFSTSLPPVGASGPQYATDVNSILTDIMARLTSKVPLSSLLVTTDLSLASFNLTNTSTVGLINLPGINSGGSSVPRIEAVLGDFYFVGPSGAVKITAGTSLNAAGLGGITGDYGGVNPAQFRYDSANTRYDAFANQGTGQWATIRALGFDIAAGSTSTLRARLAYGGAANVVYTLPTAAPASQQLMQMDTSGNMTTSNGLAINQSLFLTGTGHISRGQRSTTLPLEAFRFRQMTGATGVSFATGSPFVGIPGGCDVIHPIQMPDADNFLTTLTSVDVIRDAGGGSMTCTLYEGNYPGGFGAVASATVTGTGSTLTIPIPGTYTPSFSSSTLWVRIINATGSAQSVGAVVLHSTVA